MAVMGLELLFPRPRTTPVAVGARAYPYLLRDRELTRVNGVWSWDITYVPRRRGFMYLTAVIDWFRRYVFSWRVSNTLEGRFCLEALDEALVRAGRSSSNRPGSQFMSRECTGRLERAGIAVSRDGRGRALDNVFVERLWRSVKYEDIDIKDYERVPEWVSGLTAYDYGAPLCQSLSGPVLDELIAGRILAAVEPVALEASLAAVAEVERALSELFQHWHLRRERARYETERAAR
jgi:putative transposase